MSNPALEIEMTIPGVLKAGKWKSESELKSMSAKAQRDALANTMHDLSNQTLQFFQDLPDDRLIGNAAVTALLMAAGIRDVPTLKKESDNDHRNTLIAFTKDRTGRTLDEMWNTDNQGLARIAQQWFAAYTPPGSSEPGAGLPEPSFRDPSSSGATDRTILAYFQMLFERARAHYLAARFDEVDKVLNWLCQVFPFVLDDNTTEGYKTVIQPLIDSLVALQNNAQLRQGYDGFTNDWVPALSMAAYDTDLARNLKSFEALETSYGNYQMQSRSLTERQSDYADALGQTATLSGELTREREKIRADINSVVAEIDAAEGGVETAKKALLDAIGDLKVEIYKVFNVPDPQVLASILTNLAFMPEATPQRASMAAGQAIEGITQFMKSANSVRLDDGTEVNKSLVIRRVATVGADVTDFGAAYKVLSQNFIQASDGVYRLYQRAQDFNALCQKLYDSAGNSAVAAKAAMDEFVRKVSLRNAMIDQYNALWIRAGDIDGQQSKIKADKRVQEIILARGEDPGAHFQVAALNNLYGRFRDDCLKYLTAMGRAYAFWALRPYSQLEEVCKLADPDAITHHTLNAAKDTILNDLTAYIQDVMASFRQGSIPDQDTDLRIAKGIEITLTKSSHPKFIDGLRTEGLGKFELLPSDPAFADLFNVRVRRVRAWVHGLEPADKLHKLDITHGDLDTIVAIDKIQRTFCHDPVTVFFRYDPRKGIGDPKAIFEGAGGSDAVLSKDVYAPLGPFTTWSVSIPDSDEPGFSREGIEKVVMEFHVLAQSAGR